MTHLTRPLARLAAILLACLALALGALPASAEPTRFSVEVSGEGPDVIFIPGLATSTLVATIVAFMLGGLVVSVADELEAPPETGHAAGER